MVVVENKTKLLDIGDYATFDEINEYVKNMGFELISSPTRLHSEKKKCLNRITFNNTGNNEFLFKKL